MDEARRHLQRLHRDDRLARRRGLAPSSCHPRMDGAQEPGRACPADGAGRRDSRPSRSSGASRGIPGERPVSRVLSRRRCRHRPGDGHPSVRPTRGLSEPPAAARTPPFALLFGLAPARACRVSLPPLRRASSLWRWSSPHGGRALPANLLYGARTFLERRLSTIAPAAVRPPPGSAIVPAQPREPDWRSRMTTMARSAPLSTIAPASR